MECIEVKCEGADLKSIHQLYDFQGDLKSLSAENYNKLKLQILEFGFCEPVTCWLNPEDGRTYLGNGHQRIRVLGQMATEGFHVPPIPISWCHAKDVQEFAKIVLSLTSNYGQLEAQGTYEYLEKHQIPVEYLETRLRLPELNVPQFKQEFYSDSPEDRFMKDGVRCEKCGHLIKDSPGIR